MRRKLSQIRNPWHRLLITALVNILLGLSWLQQVSSPRARAHWIGSWRRSRRLERPVILSLFACAFMLLEPRQYAYWSTLIGGGISIFVVMYCIYILASFPRKQYHWINHR